jgi:hypothetical protein
VNTPERRYETHQQALQRIDDLFETLSKSVDSCNNGYPSAEQLHAARELGLTESQWHIGTYEHLATFHGQQVDMVRMSSVGKTSLTSSD